MTNVARNQLFTYTVQAFGAGGTPISPAITAATVTINAGTPITATVSGLNISAFVPIATTLGAGTIKTDWTETYAGVSSPGTVTQNVTFVTGTSTGVTTDWSYTFGSATISTGKIVNSLSASDSAMLFVPLTSCNDNLDGLPRDATTQTVQVAIVSTTPSVGDWKTATWQPYTGLGAPGDPAMFVQYPIGPLSGNTLTAGTYSVFVQTNGIVMFVGTLTVS